MSPAGRAHADDRAVTGQHIDRGGALQQRRPAHARALGQGHRDVHRVHPAVGRRVERGEDVVGARDREQLADLAGTDLVDVHTAMAVERRHPPVLLEAALVSGDLDQPDRAEAGGLPGLGLQPGVQVLGVHPQLGRGLGGRAERDHQAGGVPGRAGGEPVTLEQHRVGPAQFGQVVGDRRADDPATDHDHPRASREAGGARAGRVGVGRGGGRAEGGASSRLGANGSDVTRTTIRVRRPEAAGPSRRRQPCRLPTHRGPGPALGDSLRALRDWSVTGLAKTTAL